MLGDIQALAKDAALVRLVSAPDHIKMGIAIHWSHGPIISEGPLRTPLNGIPAYRLHMQRLISSASPPGLTPAPTRGFSSRLPCDLCPDHQGQPLPQVSAPVVVEGSGHLHNDEPTGGLVCVSLCVFPPQPHLLPNDWSTSGQQVRVAEQRLPSGSVWLKKLCRRILHDSEWPALQGTSSPPLSTMLALQTLGAPQVQGGRGEGQGTGECAGWGLFPR